MAVESVRRYGLSVRLDPSRVQAGAFARAAGARRFAFNQAVAAVKANHALWAGQAAAGVPKADRVRLLSAQDLERQWRQQRPDWAVEVSSWVFSWACREAATAQANFLTGQARPPRFAKKGRSRDRFSFAGRDVALESGRVSLPKIGWVRIAAACPAQAELRRLLRRGRARLTSATVSRHADGTWWLSVKVEQAVSTSPAHAHPARAVVGVDRGVTASAVASTAGCEPAGLLAGGRRRRNAEKAVAHAQREASRRYRRMRPRSEQSANWRRSQARVGRLHARAARQRANDLHRYSKTLVDANPIIVIETLATSNLLANHHLAGAIADQGWGELGRQLAYKAAWAGGQVLKAPRFFPSSKTCARCGRVKPKLDLAVRTYRCEHCGHVADRDLNAAAVLAAWGEHTLGKCPCVTQARDPDPRGRSGTSFHACRGWVSADPTHTSAAVLSGEAGTSQRPTAA